MGNIDMNSLGALNAVDITILAIIAISIIIGFGRGLVSEVLSLLTWIAAFAVSIMFTGKLSDYFMTTTMAAGSSGTTETASYVVIGISFAVLFIGTLIVGSVIKMLLNLIFSGGILGFGNRLLGGLFGMVRGYLFVLVIIFLVQLSPVAKEPWWQASQYVPKFQPQIVWLGDHISPTLSSLKDTFANTVDDMSSAIKEMSTEPMTSQPITKPAAEPAKTDTTKDAVKDKAKN